MAAKSIFGRRSVSLVFCSKENTPLTTTKIIAESLDKRHTDVLELTKRYVEDLRQFGPLPFKTEMVNRVQGGGSDREIAYLNEPQATLLISMMRNSEKVIKFKVALVKAFYEMKKKLSEQTLSYTPDQITEIENKAFKKGYAICKAESERVVTDQELFEVFDRVVKDACARQLIGDHSNYEAVSRVSSFLLKNRERFKEDYEKLKAMSESLRQIATTMDILQDGLPFSVKQSYDFAQSRLDKVRLLQEKTKLKQN